MKNKTAMVCGSSKGIGASTAIELSKLGASIILVARNEDSLSEVLTKLDSTMGQKHSYLLADFDDSQKLKDTKEDRAKYIRKFIRPIKSVLKEREFSFEIKGRPKSIYSIKKKMIKQNQIFNKKVVLVTGGSRGIGRSICIKC